MIKIKHILAGWNPKRLNVYPWGFIVYENGTILRFFVKVDWNSIWTDTELVRCGSSEVGGLEPLPDCLVFHIRERRHPFSAEEFSKTIPPKAQWLQEKDKEIRKCGTPVYWLESLVVCFFTGTWLRVSHNNDEMPWVHEASEEEFCFSGAGHPMFKMGKEMAYMPDKRRRMFPAAKPAANFRHNLFERITSHIFGARKQMTPVCNGLSRWPMLNGKSRPQAQAATIKRWVSKGVSWAGVSAAAKRYFQITTLQTDKLIELCKSKSKPK